MFTVSFIAIYLFVRAIFKRESANNNINWQQQHQSILFASYQVAREPVRAKAFHFDRFCVVLLLIIYEI